MLVDIAGRMKRMMGWCPLERVVCDHNNVFVSENIFSTDSVTYDEKNQYMDIPVQMFDWRIFAAIFSSIGLLLFGVNRSNEYVIILSLLLFALLFVMDRTKISVTRKC